MKASRELEILVAKIQEQLAPDAEVTHDIRLPGRLTGVLRQIDVLVRQSIGQHEMNIVLECKDYARRVDVKRVEEFQGLLNDVGAQKGALVCPQGFTKTAKNLATGLGIDLLSPVDTEPHKWKVRAEMPMLCDFREAKMSFGFGCSASSPFTLPADFLNSLRAFSTEGEELGTCVTTAVKKWNEAIFPSEPGVYRDLPIFDNEKVFVDNGYGKFVEVSLTVTLWVTRQLYFGHVPIERISGFKDELSGGIITNAFTTGFLKHDEVLDHWQRFEKEEDLPIKPMLGLIGRRLWSEDAIVPPY